ncbi:MAG TPA: SUMF1/EgtB/PvdO family nonheme iron enzyme, partial [Verrucomicrobiae bacterium]|nr:SUMF1/EgtB/PvdO family nonheme iron enzyme [Verrucomicrobiae bacterium]
MSHSLRSKVATAIVLFALSPVALFPFAGQAQAASHERNEQPKGRGWPAVLTNSLGMTFKLINPGSFIMGEDGGNGTETDQYPAHRVDLTKHFYMETEEVSQSFYQKSGLPGSASDISWLNADAFAKWLSKREDRTYRLPTEAEWNYVYDKALIAGMNSREWMNDWHFPYFNDHLVDPTGPSTGFVKVIR